MKRDWSKERPTQPGTYWWKWEEQDDSEAGTVDVQFARDRRLMVRVGLDFVDIDATPDPGDLWLGPITPEDVFAADGIEAVSSKPAGWSKAQADADAEVGRKLREIAEHGDVSGVYYHDDYAFGFGVTVLRRSGPDLRIEAADALERAHREVCGGGGIDLMQDHTSGSPGVIYDEPGWDGNGSPVA